jgi:uncharacterized protein DUF6624/uncharacterized protein DUF4135
MPLPAAAAGLVDAVREHRAGGIFPPIVLPGPEGVLHVERRLGGDADARFVAQMLRQPRFAPLVDLLEDLDHWCRQTARRFRSILAPGVLTSTSAGLFGPLFMEAFLACATRSAASARRFVPEQRADFEAAITLFLERLRRDAGVRWFDDPAFSLPVVGLHTHNAETHNGRQRVLRIDLHGGRRLAYKPRPTDGEALFLADSGSVFDLLNRLPAASGDVRLPVLACRRGDGPYTWEEWIEPPAQWGIIRRSGELRLRGARLGKRQASQFWHRAGSLAAACFGFGIADLGEGNVVVGARPGDDEPLLYPVDLEVYFAGVRRLYDTGLVADTARGGNHHAGLENVARWCTVDGPVAVFVQAGKGTLHLHRRRRSCAREETRTVVVDSAGHAGYGHYLPSFLRGMFDAWTLLCRNREHIRDRVEGGAYVRVLLKPTAAYSEPLDDRLLTGAAIKDVRFGRGELEQLRRMDVPYFYRAASGGPLLRWDPVRGVHVTTRVDEDGGLPPVDSVRRGDHLTLAGLGVALRDAITYVFDDLDARAITEPKLGVRLRLTDARTGEVSFDWQQVGKRVTYSWDRSTVRLRLDEFAGPVVDEAEVRRKLLRLDRVDAALRNQWADGGFADSALERQLRVLTDSAATWLRDVIRKHGWPGHGLVGKHAADAACQLVQHLEDQVDFQKECLGLIRAAAAAGDVPWRQVAYLTDTICLNEDRPQVYGTKFRNEGGTLVPCPIEQPDEVDERRKSMGMEPLNHYARRLRQRFPLPDTEVS